MVENVLLNRALDAEKKNNRFAIYLIMIFADCPEERAEEILKQMGGVDAVYLEIEKGISQCRFKAKKAIN